MLEEAYILSHAHVSSHTIVNTHTADVETCRLSNITWLSLDRSWYGACYGLRRVTDRVLVYGGDNDLFYLLHSLAHLEHLQHLILHHWWRLNCQILHL